MKTAYSVQRIAYRKAKGQEEKRTACRTTTKKTMNTVQCGVDIIEVKRIAEIVKRNNSFLERVFTKQEIEYCNSKKFKWEHFAVRFAAKEAIWKALGRKGIRLQDIGVCNADDGKPEAVINGKHRRLASHISISLSHTKEYAVAMAIYRG